MRVGFYQFDPQFGAVAKNLEMVTAKLDQAENIEDAIRFLSAREKIAVLGSADGIARLVSLSRPRPDPAIAAQ